MFAIIETGGKQFRVTPGDMIRTEKLQASVGQEVEFHQVLAIQGEEGVQVGQPYVRGARVVAKVIRQGRGPKIRVFKRKRRKGYRKTIGHRQDYTGLRIQEIQI